MTTGTRNFGGRAVVVVPFFGEQAPRGEVQPRALPAFSPPRRPRTREPPLRPLADGPPPPTLPLALAQIADVCLLFVGGGAKNKFWGRRGIRSITSFLHQKINKN